MNESTRKDAVDHLRDSAEFRTACIAQAKVSRPMGDIMTHQVEVSRWLLWVYVYPDGSQVVVC